METMELDGNGASVRWVGEHNSNVTKGFLKPFVFRLIITNFGCFLSLILQRFVAYLWPTAQLLTHCGGGHHWRWWPNLGQIPWISENRTSKAPKSAKISLWYKFPSFPFRGVSWDPLFRIPVIFNNPLIRASWIEWIWFGRFSRSKSELRPWMAMSQFHHTPTRKQTMDVVSAICAIFL